ncbi:MAG: cyclic 2,3-diphosphoglycerate synthase [archaeon]
MAEKKKVLIMGAAGTDFHVFNTYYRDNDEYEVVAFTAEQIPGIGGRIYTKELAGDLYPDGIPIFDESELPKLIKEKGVELVVFAYHDLTYEYVMHRASIVNANGADFMLTGTKKRMIKSEKPVIAVCAVRTGCGKSQTARKICDIMLKKGYKIVAIRHPMPYDQDLNSQTCQRFASREDLDKYRCTIEEREEYEPYIERGMVIYAGVDYEKILREAEKEADIILWDGGNNDFSFYKPDLYITVADPRRPGHEISYYAGEINSRLADYVIINKVDSAEEKDIKTVEKNIKSVNPNAIIIRAESKLTLDDAEAIKGRRVLVVDDGPTLTHGGLPTGAGYFAAKRNGAKEIIDPRPYAVGSIKATFEKYPQTTEVLPAMGYGDEQIKELEETINAADCDVVVDGSPVDLAKIVKVNKPIIRVTYDLEEIGEPNLETVLDEFEQKFIKK